MYVRRKIEEVLPTIRNRTHREHSHNALISSDDVARATDLIIDCHCRYWWLLLLLWYLLHFLPLSLPTQATIEHYYFCVSSTGQVSKCLNLLLLLLVLNKICFGSSRPTSRPVSPRTKPVNGGKKRGVSTWWIHLSIVPRGCAVCSRASNRFPP